MNVWGMCKKKNGYGIKREGKGEVCEWEGRAREDEVEGADHRQDDKTVDSLLWQSHQIQHRCLCGDAGCCLRGFLPLPVLSTSIAPVASGLGVSSTGHLPIPSHPHPTHPPSIQTLFLLSKRSLSGSFTLH